LALDRDHQHILTILTQEAGWAQGLVWMGEKNLAPTRVLPS